MAAYRGDGIRAELEAERRAFGPERRLDRRRGLPGVAGLRAVYAFDSCGRGFGAARSDGTGGRPCG